MSNPVSRAMKFVGYAIRASALLEQKPASVAAELMRDGHLGAALAYATYLARELARKTDLINEYLRDIEDALLDRFGETSYAAVDMPARPRVHEDLKQARLVYINGFFRVEHIDPRRGWISTPLLQCSRVVRVEAVRYLGPIYNKLQDNHHLGASK
jgi:hypothetical protein